MASVSNIFGNDSFTRPCPGICTYGEDVPHAAPAIMGSATHDLQTSICFKSATSSFSLVKEELPIDNEDCSNGTVLEQGRQGSSPTSQADGSNLAGLFMWNDAGDEAADMDRAPGPSADRREKKRISNRESARRMRLLRQRQLAALHLQVIGLEKANKQLSVETTKQRALLLQTVPSLMKNCKRLMEDKERLTLALEEMQNALQEKMMEQAASTPPALSVEAQSYARMLVTPMRRCESLHDPHRSFRGQLPAQDLHNLMSRVFSSVPDVDNSPELVASVSCPVPMSDMRADVTLGRATSWAGPSSHMDCRPVGHVGHPFDPTPLHEDLLAMLSREHFCSPSAEILEQAGPAEW